MLQYSRSRKSGALRKDLNRQEGKIKKLMEEKEVNLAEAKAQKIRRQNVKMNKIASLNADLASAREKLAKLNNKLVKEIKILRDQKNE